MAPSILDPTDDAIPQSVLLRMREDEFVAWATSDVRAEWVNGEVVLMSPASIRHDDIGNWLAIVLGMYIWEKNLGRLFGPESTVRLQHQGVSRRVPDRFFVSQANLGRLHTNHLEGPPDLAIEIVSLDSGERDWQEKYSEYEAAGVLEYWVIDPLEQEFKAFTRNELGKFAELKLDPNQVLQSVVVPGFWIKPEWLWQPNFHAPKAYLRELGIID